MTAILQSFAACTLKPLTEFKGNQTSIKPIGDGLFSVTSFFLDSSGRSSFSLPLEIAFLTEEDLQAFVKEGSIATARIIGEKTGETKENLDDESTSRSYCFALEVHSAAKDKYGDISIESVEIAETHSEANILSIRADIVVRAPTQNRLEISGSEDQTSTSSIVAAPETRFSASATIELEAVLIKHGTSTDSEERSNGAFDGLRELELGAIPDLIQHQTIGKTMTQRLSPISIKVFLAHAFDVRVSSLPGQSNGRTLVSLTINHSNTHSEEVTISNIALHPGHSKSSDRERESKGTQQHGNSNPFASINMTKSLQWKFVPSAELELPITLKPDDAYATVLEVIGTERMRSRCFVSPLSVTANIFNDVGDMGGICQRKSQRIVAASEVRWETDMVAVEPADAFRVDMVSDKAECFLGDIVTIRLRIFNLSVEAKTLMLFMAKDDVKNMSKREEDINTAVVSEMDGYTFGLWGVSSNDDGTVRLNRDNDLLGMDAALILGEVGGQHAIDAELRFIPLREGCLEVPNWRVYDKSGGKWYHCTHQLTVVGKIADEN